MTIDSTKVYKDGSKLVRPTGESPRQFSGILFVVYEGDSPETVSESVRTLDQLRGMTEVDPTTLSVPWRSALGLPDVEDSKPDTPHPSQTTIRNVRGESPIQIVETRYVKFNPSIASSSTFMFMGMAILITVVCGVNGPFLALCIFGSLLAILYQVACVYGDGMVVREEA